MKKTIIISGLLLINVIYLTGQPSGGPYGPVKQTYELPVGAKNIYYVSPDGKSESPGISIESPTLIENAITLVKTGDAIIMRGGVYRTGNLILNQGITIQPYKDEQPVLKGTFIAKDWRKLTDKLWYTKWEYLFPEKPADWWRRDRNAEKTPLHRFNNDMVFADGRFLQSADWPGDLDENTYYIDYENKEVYIAVDPEFHLIEITAFNVSIDRITGKCHGKTSDKKGPVIKGITFTQYANRAIEIEGYFPEGISEEANHGKDVTGTTLENCTISFCSRVAANLRGDKLTVKNCKISDTSTEGLYIMSSSDVLLEKNIFTRNNIELITGYFPAAVKIFNQSYRVTCNDNLVIDLPYSNGIWYDVGNVDGVYTNNWHENIGFIEGEGPANQLWPSQNAFFFEISKGAVCAGNVFVNCDHAILVLNSSNVKIYNNTLINSSLCIGRTERSAQGDHFGWHPSTGPDVDERYGHVVVNNILYGELKYKRPLLFIWQPKMLCDQLNKPMTEQLDYNICIYNKENPEKAFIFWSPSDGENCQKTYNSIQNFQNDYPEFSQNSKYYNTEDISIFYSPELGNYQLLNTFDLKEAGEVPENILKIIGNEKPEKPYIGAYPLNN